MHTDMAGVVPAEVPTALAGDLHRLRAHRELRISERCPAGGHGTTVEQRLYQLIRQPRSVTGHTFEITFLDPGVQAYSFTFG